MEILGGLAKPLPTIIINELVTWLIDAHTHTHTDCVLYLFITFNY